MKKTFERILFMVIGALIAFGAYLVGNIDNSTSAKEFDDTKFGHVVECDTLLVNHQILVGSDEIGQILLRAEQNLAAITVKHPKTGTVIIIANEEEVSNKTIYGNTLDPDSSVMIGASKEGAYLSAKSKKVVFADLSYKKISQILMDISKDEAGIAIKDNNGIKIVDTE